MRDAAATVAAVWRIEAPRLLGALVRLLGDVGAAEDVAQEALIAALETWPTSGVPDNPAAWLMTTARHRALDGLRRRGMIDRAHAALAAEGEPTVAPGHGDDVLRLVLAACHPVLGKDARVALTLKLVGGLTTDEIARAFLTPEPTIAQRIVRAKRTLTEARVPFEVPAGEALAARLPAVLDVLYLIFNEGYAAARGDDLMRPTLCAEAMRLGRVLVARVPDHAEAHGLVALMELTAARMRTRIDADGAPVLLRDQPRARWDHGLIQHGLAALARAERHGPLGPYTLQAAIAACHARAPTFEATDWIRIVALYDALVAVTGSPVVELNRAVAVAMAFGPGEALALLDELADEPALAAYHLLPAARGEVLAQLGRRIDAAAAFEQAAARAGNTRERELLLARAARLRRAPA